MLPRATPTLASLLLFASSVAQTGCGLGEFQGINAITMDDLRRDVAALASDAMRGREAGTIDEPGAAAWLARSAQEAGLEPAGEEGFFFQFSPLRRTRVSSGSSIEIGGQRFAMWEDAIVLSPVDAMVEGNLLWVGDTPADELDEATLRGRAVAAMVLPPSQLPAPGTRLWEWRYSMSAVRERSRNLLEKGATAVVQVSDSAADAAFGVAAARLMGWQTRGDGEAQRQRPGAGAPVLWVRLARLADVSRGQRLRALISTESFVFPSASYIARVPGTDPTLQGEYVLFSAHHDHNGLRAPVDGDSIYNGADDNVSGSAALLAIGRAFTRAPARRGALFVWHGAEEKGLVGSRWHAAHTVVPAGSVVAVLNADMIARNHPDSAAVLGTIPPHRNSTALADMALVANEAVAGFALDTLWDQPDHPEGPYFRSDHAPYAEAGIPALLFTSLLHSDYHTPRDESEALDYEKLLRFARWVYAAGWAAAEADERPAIDEGWEYGR